MPYIRSFGDDAPTVTAPTSTLDSVMGIVNSMPVRAAAGVASTYHGYKRTGSVGWAVLYGLLGGIFPLETVPITIAMGYGKPKKGK